MQSEFRINADDFIDQLDESSSEDETEVTRGMQKSKAELLVEVEREVKQRGWFATISSILRYLNAEHQRNPRGIRIGICTVLILVLVVTMFKSIIDCSPILFVKTGQDQVGAIDFVITSTNSSMISANTNWYATNQFDNPLALGNASVSVNLECPPWQPLDQTIENIRVCEDHLLLADSGITIFRVPYFDARLKDNTPLFVGHVPRWYIPHTSVQHEGETYPLTVTLMIINAKKENYVDIGYDWPPFRISDHQIMLQEGMLSAIDGKIGDSVTIPLDFSGVLGDNAPQKLLALMLLESNAGFVDFEANELIFNEQRIALQDFGLSPELDQTLYLDYTIAQTYAAPNGKFSLIFNNAAMIECSSVFNDLLDALKNRIAPLKKTDPEKYAEAMQVLETIKVWLLANDITFCNFALDIESVLKDQEYYYMDDYQMVMQNLVPPSVELVNALSLQSNFTLQAPLREQYKTVAIIQYFLNAIFFTVIVFLTILASMLVLALMLADVDAKTYEYGMLRALGFMKRHLMTMITFNSFYFSVPGLFIGISIAALLNVALREVIFLEAKNSLTYGLTTSALVLGITTGILVPFFANYLPIEAAMDKTLRNSLDLNKRKADSVGVKVQRLEDVGMSFNQAMISVTLTTFGFVVYYCIPLAFLTGQYSLAIFILMQILLLIVLGMVFLSTLVFSYLERLILWVLMKTCCYRDRHLYRVVTRNMDGHAQRNNKTSLIFTLATSFLIFAQSGFEIVGVMIHSKAYQVVGSDVFAHSGKDGALNEVPLRNFLEGLQVLDDQPVIDFAFGTMNINEVGKRSGVNEEIEILDVSSFLDIDRNVHIQGIPRNLLNVTGTESLIVSSYQNEVDITEIDGKPNVVDLLYTDDGVDQYPTYPSTDANAYDVLDFWVGDLTWWTGTIKMLMPTGLQDRFSAVAGDISRSTYQLRQITRAYVTQFPYNGFSGFSLIAFSPTILTSYDDFMQICHNNIWYNQINKNTWAEWVKQKKYQFIDGIPKVFLHVRLNDNISDYNRQYATNGIRSYLSMKDNLLTKQDLKESLKTLSSVFSLIVAIVGSIALFIMFYLLLIAMTQNITEAIWEYGVLRSMGLTKAEGRRVYLYEAYTVVVAATIMGVLVGISASILISAQLFTFIEMPPVFIFPYFTFAGMIVIAIITTYVAVYMPMKRVNQKQIAAVLKSGA